MYEIQELLLDTDHQATASLDRHVRALADGVLLGYYYRTLGATYDTMSLNATFQ